MKLNVMPCAPLRIDRYGKCPVMLQSWSWPQNCNHKSGQTAAHTSLLQHVHGSEQEGNTALSCHRWDCSRNLVHQKRDTDVLGSLALKHGDPDSQTWIDQLISLTTFSSDPQPRAAAVETWSAGALGWARPQTATAGNFAGCGNSHSDPRLLTALVKPAAIRNDCAEGSNYTECSSCQSSTEQNPTAHSDLQGWPVLRDSHCLFKWQKISFPNLPQLCSIHVPITSEYKDEGKVNFYIANGIQLLSFKEGFMDTGMTAQSFSHIYIEKEGGLTEQPTKERRSAADLFWNYSLTLECYSLYTSAAPGTYKVPVIHLSAHKWFGPLCSAEHYSVGTPARFQPQCLIGLGFEGGLWWDFPSPSYFCLGAINVGWCCLFCGVFPSLWDRRDTVTLQMTMVSATDSEGKAEKKNMTLHDSISPFSMDVCAHVSACTCSKSEQETSLKEVNSWFQPLQQTPIFILLGGLEEILKHGSYLISRWFSGGEKEKNRGKNSLSLHMLEWLHVSGIEQN